MRKIYMINWLEIGIRLNAMEVGSIFMESK